MQLLRRIGRGFAHRRALHPACLGMIGIDERAVAQRGRRQSSMRAEPARFMIIPNFDAKPARDILGRNNRWFGRCRFGRHLGCPRHLRTHPIEPTRTHQRKAFGPQRCRSDRSRIAIVGRLSVESSGEDDTLAMAHDDHWSADKRLQELGLKAEVVGRARSLALIRISEFVAVDDRRIDLARKAGLDGLRIVGVRPRP